MSNEINDIVDVVITVESSAVTRAGFGTPLFVTTNAVAVPRVVYYEGDSILTEIAGDGFATNSPAYLMAQSALAQTPRPSRIALGQRLAGDATPAAAIAAISAYDNTGWYGWATDSKLEADLLAYALWTETQQHLFVAATEDAGVLTQAAGNVAADLQGFAYRRTALFWHDPATEDYIQAAMLGVAATVDLDLADGQITWANKTLVGIAPDPLTAAQRTVLHDYNCNTYERRLGKNVTREGVSVHGEFIDVQVTVDWLDARMTEDVFAAITAPGKLPFTAAGLNVIETVVRKRLQIAVDNGHLESFTLSIPKITDILGSDRAARVLRNVNFSGVPSGAIHTAIIRGKVSV